MLSRPHSGRRIGLLEGRESMAPELVLLPILFHERPGDGMLRNQLPCVFR
jgi:hypothetical protein